VDLPRATPDRRGRKRALAALGGAAGAVALLSVAEVLPPIGLVLLGFTAAVAGRTTPLQATAMTAIAVVVTAAALVVLPVTPRHTALALAAIVALPLVVLVTHAQARAADRARRVLARREAHLAAVVDLVDHAVGVIGRDRQVLMANRAAERILRFGGERAGQAPAERLSELEWLDASGAPLAPAEHPIDQGLAGTEVSDVRLGVRGPDGAVVWADVWTHLVPDERGTEAVVLVLRDVTGAVHAAERAEDESAVLRHRARHDALTGLANRHHLLERLDEARPVDGDRRATGLLYIDLDGFKSVNDTWGHVVGDEVLVQVGLRLRATSRHADVAARLGGDEFVRLCTGLDPELAELELVRTAARTEAILAEPYQTSAGSLRIGASVGWALARPGERLGVDVLDRADGAMLAAKRHRRTAAGRSGAGLAPRPVGRTGSASGGGDLMTANGADGPAARTVRVFVVDDDPAMRLLATRIIETSGGGLAVAGEAGDGMTAVERILADPPDLVLCDVMMPGMDGPAVVTAVQARAPDQPFVFWSATSTPALERHRQALGVPFVPKERLEDLPDVLRHLGGAGIRPRAQGSP
jgi:diguanylate cyclase (GGDEF)-like protein